MNGRCHCFIVFRALFEEFHLEKKCDILNDICECAKDTERWCDYTDTSVSSVEMVEEGGGLCFYMMASSLMVGASWIVSYPVVCPGLCVSY